MVIARYEQAGIAGCEQSTGGIEVCNSRDPDVRLIDHWFLQRATSSRSIRLSASRHPRPADRANLYALAGNTRLGPEPAPREHGRRRSFVSLPPRPSCPTSKPCAAEPKQGNLAA